MIPSPWHQATPTHGMPERDGRGSARVRGQHQRHSLAHNSTPWLGSEGRARGAMCARPPQQGSRYTEADRRGTRVPAGRLVVCQTVRATLTPLGEPIRSGRQSLRRAVGCVSDSSVVSDDSTVVSRLLCPSISHFEFSSQVSSGHRRWSDWSQKSGPGRHSEWDRTRKGGREWTRCHVHLASSEGHH